MAEKKGVMLSLVKVIKEEERKFLERNDEKSVRKFVREKLESQKEDLLKTYLGFKKDSWHGSKWEIDHCNGRADNSPVGKTIKDIIEEELQNWMGDAIREMARQAFEKNNDLYDPIKREIKKKLDWKLTSIIQGVVESKVEAYIQKEVTKQLQHHVDEVDFLKEMIDE